MTARERLTNSQIVLLRYLIQRGASLRAVTVAQWQRVVALPLWRRGLIDIWWRLASCVEILSRLEGPPEARSRHRATREPLRQRLTL